MKKPYSHLHTEILHHWSSNESPLLFARQGEPANYFHRLCVIPNCVSLCVIWSVMSITDMILAWGPAWGPSGYLGLNGIRLLLGHYSDVPWVCTARSVCHTWEQSLRLLHVSETWGLIWTRERFSAAMPWVATGGNVLNLSRFSNTLMCQPSSLKYGNKNLLSPLMTLWVHSPA